MSLSNKRLIAVLIIFLFVPIIYLQRLIDPQRHQFEPGMKNLPGAVQQLPIEFALGAVIGFREAIAGLLWVRTDEFFDEGNYDAIVPMVRIITWLDPHNIDVYETGAWHLDYNFTDADQRSDRRYIPYSVALLQEGIINNPTTPDLYADLAFTHFYRKIQDFPDAVKTYLAGEKVKGWSVTTIGHGLAHAYQSNGQIPEEIAQWKLCVEKHKENLANLPKGDDSDRVSEQQGLNVAQKNLEETEDRYKWRQIQTKPPFDVHFSATLTRIAPMVFVVKGAMNMIGSSPGYNLQTGAHTWSPQDGARVEIRLQDADYVMPTNAVVGLTPNLPRTTTIMQDAASVNKGKFQKKIDMSKDHNGVDPMYSFAAPTYTVTLWWNPANTNDTPPNIADRVGWLGEGMTDDNPAYVDTSGVLPGTAGAVTPGLRMIKKVFTLTREDIMGSGVQTFN